MKLHPEVEAYVEFEKAREALATGVSLAALSHLERALKLHDNPSWHSFLGYCIAKERGHVRKGIDLCLAALEREPEVSAHYLYLGKIYLLAGNKPEALRVFREGMGRGPDENIQMMLGKIGTRKPPVITSLPRTHLFNRSLGVLLSRIGIHGRRDAELPPPSRHFSSPVTHSN